MTVRGRSELVNLTICWADAQQTTAVIRRPIQRFEDLSGGLKRPTKIDSFHRL